MTRSLPLSLAAALLLPVVLGAQGTDLTGYRPVGLDEAVRLAQQNAPAAVQARGAIRNAEGAIKTTRAQWLPTISSSLGQSKGGGQNRNPVTGQIQSYAERPWSYSTGVSASYTLWDGGRRFADADARRADLTSAEVTEVTARFSVALQVKQQYYAILAARESESAARIQVQQAEQQLAASSARLLAGAVNISDSLRSAINLRQQQLNLVNSQNNLRNASAALTRLVGSQELLTALPSDTAAPVLVRVDSAEVVRLAMAGPSVRSAEASLAAARATQRSQRGTLWPTVGASASYSGNGRDQLYGLRERFAYGYNYSLNVSYPLFDRYARSENIARSSVTVDNAEASLRDSRLLAQQNVIQQLGALRTAEEQIRINELQVGAAEEDLRVQQTRYNVGSSTLLEVSTSLAALNNARAALIQARQNYRVARAQLESTIGQDLR
jgi:outer membrane protein